MTPHTNILLDTTSAPVTGTLDGAWFAFQKDDRSHNVVGISIVSGTGTVILEGRVDQNSDPVQITTATVSASPLCAQFLQMRARITGGTALVAKVHVDRMGLIIS